MIGRDDGSDLEVRGATAPLAGSLRPASDKSITHRALILAALAAGKSAIRDALDSDDVRATRECLGRIGAKIEERDGVLRVQGIDGRPTPRARLDCRESGTTARLLLGALAGLPIDARFDGADRLRGRPMRRVVAPLAAIGARFDPPLAAALPLLLRGGGPLRPFRETAPVSSAQVKSALLLAALRAEGRSAIAEPVRSRDHTERMLPLFGAAVERGDHGVAIDGPQTLRAADVRVPADVSSALYPGVAALLVEGSSVELRGVGVNPTRTGALEVLARMGARIERREREPAGGEPVADLRFAASELRGVEVEPELFPRLLDDVPILAVAACAARGRTVFHGAGELRVKESDRIASVIALVRAFGGEASADGDSLAIEGGRALTPGRADACGDHRIALAAIALALATKGTSSIRGAAALSKSYPTALADFRSLLRS